MEPARRLELAAHETVRSAGGGVAAWLGGWWRLLHLSAMVLVLALSPVTWRASSRAALLRQSYLAAAPMLAWFTLVAALVSLILTRIVVTTARSYGLDQFALETVVRTLVLELLPLAAPLFVALRYSIPGADELYARRMSGRGRGGEPRAIPLTTAAVEFMPRVAAGVFACVLLVAISCVVSLALAYFSVYGFSNAGWPEYTRRVGAVFDGSASLIFVLKTLLFSLAVSLIPLTSTFYDAARHLSQSRAELHGLVRLFAVILLIEVVALVGNYS